MEGWKQLLVMITFYAFTLFCFVFFPVSIIVLTIVMIIIWYFLKKYKDEQKKKKLGNKQ